jgi:hypothetical protein
MAQEKYNPLQPGVLKYVQPMDRDNKLPLEVGLNKVMKVTHQLEPFTFELGKNSAPMNIEAAKFIQHHAKNWENFQLAAATVKKMCESAPHLKDFFKQPGMVDGCFLKFVPMVPKE